MTYQEIIRKIKNLEIQGAQAVAIKGIEAFGIKLKETTDPNKLKKVIKELISLRSTEPALRNGLKYCFANRYEKDIIKKAMNYFQTSQELIAEIGAKKIRNGMKIFTHCHSSTVEAILIKAKEQKKVFEVFNTETRPRFQGRITAINLAKHKIPVTHMVDSAGRAIIRKCDLFLFGCDAITSEGHLFNKIGTESLIDAAFEADIDSYSATSSWKFDPETIKGTSTKIEQRNSSEVWDKPPKGVKIFNPAFEIINPDKFTGVITELGIFKAEAMISKFEKAYPYLV